MRLYMETELVYAAEHAVDIQGFFDRVMEEFLTLRVDDPGIGVDFQRREVSIGLVAQGGRFEDAVAAGIERHSDGHPRGWWCDTGLARARVLGKAHHCSG